MYFMPDPVQWFANSREALIPTCHWLNCVQVSWICECLPWDKYWLVATDIAPCMWPRQGRNLSFNRSYTKMVTPELDRTDQDRFSICEALPGSWCQVWIPAVCGSVSQGESLKYIYIYKMDQFKGHFTGNTHISSYFMGAMHGFLWISP